MDQKLTARQHEVMSLRFWEDQTQVQIAERLAISQPTVNQHLTGKRRNGKKIGGANINKHFEGRAPLTAERFLEVLRQKQ